MEEGTVRHPVLGSPQGGVISPLLANIYLDALDDVWERRCRHLGRLVRYADDFVVLCRTRVQAEESLRRLQLIMERLRLRLHPEKTRIVEPGLGKGGFAFLGCYLRIVRSGARTPPTCRDYPLPRLRECHMKRLSVSRMREIRTYGLKGGFRSPGPQGHRA